MFHAICCANAQDDKGVVLYWDFLLTTRNRNQFDMFCDESFDDIIEDVNAILPPGFHVDDCIETVRTVDQQEASKWQGARLDLSL